jgi:hypothetical protein
MQRTSAPALPHQPSGRVAAAVMSSWRAKPAVVKAFRWTGGLDQQEDPEWIVAAIEAA